MDTFDPATLTFEDLAAKYMMTTQSVQQFRQTLPEHHECRLALGP